MVQLTIEMKLFQVDVGGCVKETQVPSRGSYNKLLTVVHGNSISDPLLYPPLLIGRFVLASIIGPLKAQLTVPHTNDAFLLDNSPD